MSKPPIRVLVVDDSPLIRELISDALAVHPEIEVVGKAGDGEQALQLMDTLQPDVVTLDLQMPRMGGLETLDEMLKRNPLPVIVVSSLTQRAADTTLQALQSGALDYVAKPEGAAAMQRVFGEELPGKIRNMAGADVRRILQYRQSREVRAKAQLSAADARSAEQFASGCVAIGVSTGGPPALSKLFSTLAPPLPPIIVVQHMPQLFTGPFANRLNAISSLTVKEAATGDVLRPNCAYIAPGGIHLAVERSNSQVTIALREGAFVSGHKPSVDVMMKSTAHVYGPCCVGVIMTGMGRDGVTGCGAIKAAGGYVIGQDETTSDVYGMNKVAFVEGHVDRQVGVDELAETIMFEANKRCTSNRKLQPA